MARTRQQKQPYLLGICLIALCALQTSAYDLNLPAGYNFIGNNLSRPPNDLNTILGPSAGIIPAGSEVFKWQNGSNSAAPYLCSIYDGTTWSSNLSFAPGEAVFLRVSSPVSLTFTGVAATLNLPVEIGGNNDDKLYTYSDQHPPGGTSDWFTITGTSPEQPARAVSLWTGTNFLEYDCDPWDSTWSGPDHVNGPPVPVGGAMFIQSYGSIGPVPSPIPPSLTIIRTPTNTVVVQWPYPSFGFILQQHTNPSTTNWIASTNEIHTNLLYDIYKFITVSPPVESRYYRLFRP